MLLCLTAAMTQNSAFIDLGNIIKYDTVLNRLSYYIDTSNTLNINDAHTFTFSYPDKRFPFKDRHPGAGCIIKLSVTNSGNLDTFWLYMGKAQTYTMYEYDSSNSKFIPLNNQFTSYSSPVLNKVPYSYLVVKKGEYKHFYIQTIIRFYNWHQFDPVILLPHEQTDFTFNHFIGPNRLFIYTTFALLGVMLSMLVYSLTIFLQSYKNEYLYFTLILLGFIVYFFIRLLNTFIFSKSYYYFYDIRYQVLQLGESILALLFVVSFLKIKTTIPKLYKHARIIIITLLIFIFVNIPITYTDQYNYIGNIAFDIIRISVLPYFGYLLFELLKERQDKEVRYIGAGAIIGSLVWVAVSIIDRGGEYKYHFLEHSGLTALIFMTCIVFEMLFFMQALIYRKKTKEALQIQAVEQLQLENDRKELEKFRAVIDARDKERNRISQEIHDEIGSGLTSIRLLSEITKIKGSNDDTDKTLEKISGTANSLMDNMNEIIWTLNSKNDPLPNLIAYLRHYIVNYFEHLQIHLNIVIPDHINEVSVTGKIRRNILLAVKEALHNIVKHSKATVVDVQFSTGAMLNISISDNGIGINPSLINDHHNGLQNIRNRLSAIGGTCTFTSHNGTSVILELPLS